MLRIVSIAAAVLIGAAAFAYAGDQGDPDQSCDGSTYEIGRVPEGENGAVGQPHDHRLPTHVECR